jgi:hypothetical protein
MGKVAQFVCDNPKCGALKRSENHWWKVRIAFDHIILLPFDPDVPVLDCERIFCGEPCTIKVVSEWMGNHQALEADSQADGVKG